MSDMCVIVPSRGRPDNINRLIHNWMVMDTLAELLVVMDDDDDRLDEYKESILALDAPNVFSMIGPRLRLAPTLSKVATDKANHNKYIGFMGDDHLPRTLDWDSTIEHRLEVMGTGIAYGNDLHQGAALPTAVFMTSNIIKTLGYMCPPNFIHLYLDNIWRDWGQAIQKLEYLPDVTIEHMHPNAGQAEWDDRYEEVNSVKMYNHDRTLYEEYMAGQFQVDVDKLKGLL